jgi:serine/threonine protein kinase
MTCPACNAVNDQDTEECFACGRALFALTQGRILAARYEIRRPIGQGGMGKVYEAYDRMLGERVAVKVLRPQFAREPDMARRFLSEIRLARRITHPNVCRLHEYGEDEGIRYLCMELVDGVNLKDVLRARRLGTEDAFDVALAAAEGLGAVHAQGVIHRDFKTANIMIDRRGQVKVMDFGIAKEVGSDTTGISLAGHVLGTPEYMSPEHAQGGPIDLRSDVYALGCVVFEVFAGRALFQGTSPLDTLRRHLHEPLPFVTASGLLVPEPLEPVLARALAKKADDRYPTVAELIEDLRAARSASALHAVLGDDVEPLADLAALLAPSRPEPPPIESARYETPRAEHARSVPPASERHAGARLAVHDPRGDAAGSQPTPSSAAPARLVGFASMAVIVGVLAYAWWRGQPGRTDAARPVSAAAIPSSPPSTLASRPTPAAEAAATPAPLPVARVDRPHERLRTVAPTVQLVPQTPPDTTMPDPTLPARTVQVAVIEPAPAPTPAASEEEQGILSLLVVPPANVSIDGTPLGVVSSRQVRLTPGAHTVLVEHAQYRPYPRKVMVQSGATRELVVDLSEKGVRAR